MFKKASKRDKFFVLFNKIAQNTFKSASILQEFLGKLNEPKENLEKLKEIEHKGDVLQHEVIEQLNKTFLTPFDREDIYIIANDMDNIIDYIESTANRFDMMNVSYSTKNCEILANMIYKACEQIEILMEQFENNNDVSKMIIEVNRIEEEGDKVSRKAIKNLFINDNLEVLEIIKWKEIYEFLEKTLDACEDVANVIEGVVMKNA